MSGFRVPLILSFFLASCGGSSGDAATTGGIDTFFATPRVRGYVRSETYDRLVLEVDSVAGFEPRSTSSNDLTALLGDLLDKPRGIEVTIDGTIASRGSSYVWTLAELEALAEQTDDLVVDAGTIRIHVLFVDGTYDSGDGGTVLGIAWNNRNIAIFQQSIRDTCNASGVPVLLQDQLCADAELYVWAHEAGHTIGLVDNGLPMVVPHEDVNHPAHDADADCVMYWAYDGGALIDRLATDLLGGGQATLSFDAYCQQDVAALRDTP